MTAGRLRAAGWRLRGRNRNTNVSHLLESPLGGFSEASLEHCWRQNTQTEAAHLELPPSSITVEDLPPPSEREDLRQHAGVGGHSPA